MYISRLAYRYQSDEISKGLSVDLEYADEVTLSKAIAGRTEM